MEGYLILVVILNFLVNFFLLLGTNRLSGFPAEPGRCALAALLGGIYSGGCLLHSFRFLGTAPWHLVSLAGMAVTAFGLDRSAVKRGMVFFLLHMAMGGIALSLGRGAQLPLLPGAVLVWLLCCAAFTEAGGGREYVPVTLTYGEKSASLIALRDTGNTLRDPITGEQVLVVSGRIGQKLTGLTPAQLGTPLQTLAQHPIPGLRLIPYRTVGQNSGMMLALRLPSVTIGSRTRSTLVAFAPEGLDGTDMYQALTGGAL